MGLHLCMPQKEAYEHQILGEETTKRGSSTTGGVSDLIRGYYLAHRPGTDLYKWHRAWQSLEAFKVYRDAGRWRTEEHYARGRLKDQQWQLIIRLKRRRNQFNLRAKWSSAASVASPLQRRVRQLAIIANVRQNGL